jgi:ATP-dependent protease ClpP protease subunit
MADVAAAKVHFRLNFNANIALDSANQLRSRVATILAQPTFGALTIVFSSEGGSTDQSLSLYNFLRELPVALHMHAIGHVGSASLPVFLAADIRTCTPLSRFFIHEYDWGFDSRQTLNRMAEAQKRLRSDIDLARKIAESRTSIPGSVLDALDGRAAPAVIEPTEAKSHGIVNNVCQLGKTGVDGMPVAIWAL